MSDKANSIHEPEVGPFAARSGRHFPKLTLMYGAPLTAARLRETLALFKAGTSCGADGWRLPEIKALLLECLERLNQLYQAIETTGTWPQGIAEGLVTLLPKGEGARPFDLRPITVMPVIYRLWAATRLKDVVA